MEKAEIKTEMCDSCLFLSFSVKFEPLAASAEREGDQDYDDRALNGEKGVSRSRSSSNSRETSEKRKFSVSCPRVEKAFQMTFLCQSKAQHFEPEQLL